MTWFIFSSYSIESLRKNSTVKKKQQTLLGLLLMPLSTVILTTSSTEISRYCTQCMLIYKYYSLKTRCILLRTPQHPSSRFPILVSQGLSALRPWQPQLAVPLVMWLQKFWNRNHMEKNVTTGVLELWYISCKLFLIKYLQTVRIPSFLWWR